jgi:hypothetical protein
MKPPTLNQVAIWVAMKRDELDVKTYQNYQFMHKGIIRSATSIDPIVRYAKNYKYKGVKFSLCLISLEKDTKAMEKFLDKVAKGIQYDPKGKAFIKTEIYYGA